MGQVQDENNKPLAQSFIGFGTGLYGKRNFQRDGSFIATLWIVLLWIPVIPLKSVRVKKNGRGELFSPFGSVRWSQNYLVFSKSRPDVRQVINIYLFLAVFLIGAQIHAGANVELAGIAIWACIPWAMRTLARSLQFTANSAE